jgi:hypothetical protein
MGEAKRRRLACEAGLGVNNAGTKKQVKSREVVYRWDSVAGGPRLVEADRKPVENGPLLDAAGSERAMEEHVSAIVSGYCGVERSGRLVRVSHDENGDRPHRVRAAESAGRLVSALLRR